MSHSSEEFQNARNEAKVALAKAKALRSWFQKKRFIIPIALIVLIGLSNTFEKGGDTSTSSANTSTSSANTSSSSSQSNTNQSSVASDVPVSEPDPYANETVSQANARGTAQDYINYGAFSRSGLIKQLEYEGYSKSDSEYAVDILKIDWNEQAAKTAKDYLDYDSFSRSGLLDQLIFEGFTKAQAEYGVSTTGL